MSEYRRWIGTFFSNCINCGRPWKDCCCVRLKNITNDWISGLPCMDCDRPKVDCICAAGPNHHSVNPSASEMWGVGGMGMPTPDTNIPAPQTKPGCDELRRMILELPDGFLAKLYADLYAKGLRIDSARSDAEKYYRGLKNG